MKTRLVNPQAIRFSLGWKTTAMVLLPILLGTLATAWLLLAILEQENRMSVRQLMNQEMLVLDRELAFMEKEVERLAVNPVLINALANPDMLQGTLPELLGRFSQGMRIRSFVLTDPVGASVFAHGDPLPQYKELPNLKEALATGKAISHLDLTKKMVLVAAPVHYFNNIQGVIVSGFDVGAIMNRLISEGGQRRMVVGNQKLDVGRVAKGDKWESLAASSQTPMLYRLGVSVDAAVEELRIGTIILKSVAFVCLMGVGITLAVWFLMSRAVSRAGETILNTVGTGRAGRVRGLATAPAAVRKGGGEPVKTENVATESPPEDLENRLGDRNQEIENSRQWLRYVIDAVADRLFWKDREGVYRGCNRAFAQDAGLANVADVENLRETDMPWQEMVAQFLEFEQTVMEENRPMTPREGMIRTRSGIDLKIYFDRIPVKNGAGDIIGVLGVYQLAEQEGPGMEQRLLEYDTLLQSMFHVMEEGLWEWDLISGEMVFNSRWWEMLGIDGDSVEIDREAWRRRVHPGDWSEVEGLVERHLSGVTMVYESEHRIRHQDGHWLWVLERGRISQWKNDGTPLRMVCAVWDISAEKQSEATTIHEVALLETREETIDAPPIHAALPEKIPSPLALVVAVPACEPPGETVAVAADDVSAPLEPPHATMPDILDVPEEVTTPPSAIIATQSAVLPVATETSVISEKTSALPWPVVPGFDVAAGLEQTGGNEQMYRHLLIGFHEKHQDMAQRLRDMLTKSRYDRISKEIQGIREILFDLGALSLHDQAVALEGVLTCTPRKKETIAHYFVPFCQALDVWIEALKKWQEGGEKVLDLGGRLEALGQAMEVDVNQALALAQDILAELTSGPGAKDGEMLVRQLQEKELGQAKATFRGLIKKLAGGRQPEISD